METAISIIFTTIFPVFFIILLGYMLKQKKFPGDEFWPYAEQITFYLFLPLLFFESIVGADFSESPNLIPLIGGTLLASVLMTGILFLLRPILTIDGPAFSSLFQGAIRFNNYVGIPVILSLHGREGLVIYAVIIAFAIPFTNVLCVAVLTHYGSGSHRFETKKVLNRIIRNPLIISSLIGIAYNLLKIPMPSTVGDIIHLLGAASVPLGLLSIGAGTHMEALRSTKGTLLLACGLKLVLQPLLIFACLFALGIRNGMALEIAVIYGSLPTATSSYIMTRQLGGDGRLMASITVALTLGAAVTMPIVLLIMH